MDRTSHSKTKCAKQRPKKEENAGKQNHMGGIGNWQWLDKNVITGVKNRLDYTDHTY